MRTYFMGPVFVLVAALVLGSPALAQIYPPSSEGHRAQQALKAAAAAPKPTYDPHDLSGVWWGLNSAIPSEGTILMGNPAPEMTPLGQQRFNANKPSAGPRGVAPGSGNDPLGQCDPIGYPRNLLQNTRAFEFIQVPGKIVQIFEWNFAVRQIWLDGRKIPDDLDPRWFGYAVGHFEGDTLVVDSTGYNDKTWLDGFGYPHSEDMKLEERWKHPDAMTLSVDMTLTDPTIYTKPWTNKKPMTYQLQLPKGLTELEEAYCVPSEEQSFNENLRNPAAGVKQK
jgi:hypothetical protein